GPFLASLQLSVKSISRRSTSCVSKTAKSPTIGVSAISFRSCSRSEGGLSRRKDYKGLMIPPSSSLHARLYVERRYEETPRSALFSGIPDMSGTISGCEDSGLRERSR